MIDISDTIIAKSDQLNADDLIGNELVIEISGAKKVDSAEQPVILSFKNDNGKPWKPCKTMRRILVECWGVDASKYVGRSIKLYRDEKVTWAGMEVGGVRIKELSHIEKPVKLVLALTSKTKKPYVVNPLSVVEKPKAATIEKLRELADDAAKSGIDDLKKWFGSLSSEDKKTIQPELDKYKQLATQEKEENNEESL